MTIIKSSTAADTSAARIAEQRARQWAINLEAQRQRLDRATTSELQVDTHPYVAISREAGAGGAAIARRVGELLGWDVLDRELLDLMAEKYNLPRNMLGNIDENTSNWIIEVFGKWLDPRLITQTEYIVHLGHVVLLAAQHTNTVFVGRGAQFFLPPEKGLSVFLVAPMAQRINYVREIRGCSKVDARRYIQETDKGRSDFVKSHFNQQIGNPHLYDLVINRAHTSMEDAAELIAQQCRSRFSGI